MKSQIEKACEFGMGSGGWTVDRGLQSQIENAAEERTARGGRRREGGLNSHIHNAREERIRRQRRSGSVDYNCRLKTHGRRIEENGMDGAGRIEIAGSIRRGRGDGTRRIERVEALKSQNENEGDDGMRRAGWKREGGLKSQIKDAGEKGMERGEVERLRED